MQIAVVDLGIGNLRSVEQALHAVAGNVNVLVTGVASDIERADKIVLPGQGAVDTWFNELRSRGLESVIKNSIGQKPLLGICVGMQALFEHCEEGGGESGLGVFEGSVKHFKHFHDLELAHDAEWFNSRKLKIPQMGWNQVQQSQDHALWQGIADQSYFYFVHSFCANTSEDQAAVYGQANYGHEFIAAVGREQLFATQFHPEKSHDDGLRLLKNFTQWSGLA